MRYEIKHISRYLYAAPVRRCAMMLCLKPRRDPRQNILDFRVSTTPHTPLTSEMDSYGNMKHILNIYREHDALEVTADSTVQMASTGPGPRSLGLSSWEEVRSWAGSFDYWDFMHPSTFARPSSALAGFVDRLGIKPEGDPLGSLLNLSDMLHHTLEYVPGSTSVVSPIDHILESGQGVCQDYAHVMIAIARSWGVPVRYVSGYLYVDETGGYAPEAATHAWVECRLPSLGWVGFDPTNKSFIDERYVRIAVGRDYQDVAPTSGILMGGGETSLEVSVMMRATG